jgi:hypothetical protein
LSIDVFFMSSQENYGGLLFIGAGVGLLLIAFGGGWLLAPDIQVQSDSASARTDVVGVHGSGAVAVVNQSAVEWNYQNADSYFDVTTLENGHVLASYGIKDTTACGPFPTPCAETGVRIIDPDPNPHVVSEWSFPVRDLRDSEVHDAEMLSDGDLLVADMEYERIFTVDPETDERTYIWNASDYYSDVPDDPTRTDWLHINDVDRLSEDRYLVSVRNKNQLVVIEDGDVVEGVNEDGSRRTLFKQHNPQWLSPSAILVSDSENNRIVELHEQNGRWRVAWSISVVNGIRLDWPRDADRLPNGNTLITDSANNRVVEITAQGAVVRSYQIERVPYEADRLPGGEQLGGEVYEDVGTLSKTRSTDIPVVTPLLIGARILLPIPFWVSEAHAVVALLSLLLIGTGSVRRYPGVLDRVAAADSVAEPVYRRFAALESWISIAGGVAGICLLLSATINSSFTRVRLGLGVALVLLSVETIWDALGQKYRNVVRFGSVLGGISTAVVLAVSALVSTSAILLDVVILLTVVGATVRVASRA